MDWYFERHQNCPFFEQLPWMWAEGKYICKNTEDRETLFLCEIPPNCIKGFKKYLFPAGKPYHPPKNKAKIYKFEPKEQ